MNSTSNSLSILEGQLCPFPNHLSLATYFQHRIEKGEISLSSIALLWRNVPYTFEWVDNTSNFLASVLKSAKTDKSATSLVGICVPPSEKAIALLFAILKLEATYVPIDESYPEERVKHICDSCHLKFIIVDRQYHQKFQSILKDRANVELIFFEELYENALKLSQEFPNILNTECNNSGDNLLAVLYTSGSSGPPKGVRITNRNVLNRLTWQLKTFPFTLHDICVWKTSLTFVDSICEIFGPLLAGITLAIMGKEQTKEPESLVKAIYEYQVTRLILVPSLLKTILATMKHLEINNNEEEANEPKRRNLLSSVRIWICSGETLPMSLAQQFFTIFKHDVQLANFYGSTEIMGDVSCVTFINEREVIEKSSPEGVLPIGELVVSNTATYIVEPLSQEIVNDGQTGEIYIGGANVTGGYISAEKDTRFLANPFTNAPGFERLFSTGDFGTLVHAKNGRRLLYYKGRADGQLKVRGQRVSTTEIESTITNHCSHSVEKVCVICHKPNSPEQVVLAFVIPKCPSITKRELQTEIRSKLRPCEYPEIHLVSSFPTLVNGKINRQLLLSEYEESRRALEGITLTRVDFREIISTNLPPHKLERTKILVQVMSEITGTPVQEIAENLQLSFYLLGGNSLNSVAVVVKLWEHGYHMEVSDFINASSVQCIVDLMNPRLVKKNSACDMTFGSGKKLEEQAIQVPQYHIEVLKGEHRKQVISILAKGFSEKGDLEHYTGATFEDYEKYISSIWDEAVGNGLCFVCIRSCDHEIIGVSFNFDFVDFSQLSPITNSKGIQHVFEIIQFIQNSISRKLPNEKGQLIRSSLLGTDASLDHAKNVHVMQLMSKHLTQLATLKGFQAILSINTSSLTQQIDRDVQGFETLVECQINQFVGGDGTKPFLDAPDSQLVICSMKYL